MDDDKCNKCELARAEISRLSALVDRIGLALKIQDERWGLYTNESQQALKEFNAQKETHPR